MGILCEGAMYVLCHAYECVVHENVVMHETILSIHEAVLQILRGHESYIHIPYI